MTLHTYDDIEQGSDEWLLARCGILTASVMGQLITTKTVKLASNETSRALTRSLVAEKITGRVEDTFTSSDMQRGIMAEPYARDIYAEHYAPVEEIGFMVREDHGTRVGYSPDGLVGSDGLIEIKSPRAKTHLNTLLTGTVPAEYMAQLQTGLWVSGRGWIDYISYHGGLPLYVTTVLPDAAWQEAIKHAAIRFQEEAETMLDAYYAAAKHLPPTEYIDLFEEEGIVI